MANSIKAGKPLIVRDPIHKDMTFDFPLELIIDHPLFQRLKFILQNGVCYQVFPGMTHTRFQHSLGVCWIATKWFDQLIGQNCLQLIDDLAKQNAQFGFTQGQEIDLKKTKLAYQEAKVSKDRWRLLVGIASLCHDLGHGPFSHLLEESHFIPAKKIIEELPDFLNGASPTVLTTYLKDKYSEKSKKGNESVDHEDLTLIYLAKIFYELESKNEFFKEVENLHIASSLISKQYKAFYTKDHVKYISEIYLFSAITSGFIDADRLDYIVRDSTMAGVQLGGIEIDRIICSLIPCLFLDCRNTTNGFITHFKYNHIIDCFFFSLYQIYTQVLFHPRAVQMNYEISLLLSEYSYFFSNSGNSYLNWHSVTTDQIFMGQLKNSTFDPSEKLIDQILNRSFSKNSSKVKCVYGLPDNMEKEKLKDYDRLQTQSRAMLKDDSIIWYYTKITDTFGFKNWNQVSIVSQKLTGHSFTPNIFWKNEDFMNEMAKLNPSKKSKGKQAS